MTKLKVCIKFPIFQNKFGSFSKGEERREEKERKGEEKEGKREKGRANKNKKYWGMVGEIREMERK